MTRMPSYCLETNSEYWIILSELCNLPLKGQSFGRFCLSSMQFQKEGCQLGYVKELKMKLQIEYHVDWFMSFL